MSTTIKPGTASVLVYQGDDLARIFELKQAVEVAERRVRAHEMARKLGTAREGDAPSAQAEKDAYDAFVLEAAERAVEVEVQAIGRKRFRRLVTEHPPRKVKVTKTDEDGGERTVEETHPDDEAFGVNTETFPDALLLFVDKDDTDVRTIVAPSFSTSAERQAFLDFELGDGQYDELWQAAYVVNRRGLADPKASLYSTASPRLTEI